MQSLAGHYHSFSCYRDDLLVRPSQLLGVMQLVIAAMAISFVPLLVPRSEVESLGSAAIRLALAAPVSWLLYQQIGPGYDGTGPSHQT